MSRHWRCAAVLALAVLHAALGAAPAHADAASAAAGLATGTGAVPAAVAYHINAGAAASAFPHVWEECVGSGHAALALRRDWQQQLAATHRDTGVKRVRFHGILDDDVGVVAAVGDSGQLLFNFTLLDRIYDAIAAAGMRPYVELDFMPPALANGTATYLHYKANVTPPKNLTQWRELVTGLTSHVVERYPAPESTPWMFEVWNEPNLRNTFGPINLGEFWTGTQAEYFTLYRDTAKAVKLACAACQVGGPATAGGAWLAAFLNFTRATSAPVDFVSTHGYPNQVGDGNDPLAMEALVAAARAQVGDTMPLVYSEYNSGLYPFFVDNNDTPFAAAFVVRTAALLDKFQLTALSYWTFSDIFDELFFDPLPFHDGYGLLTVQGVPKPAYRAFQLLHSLGTERVPVVRISLPPANSSPANVSLAVLATRNTTHLQVTLSNFYTPDVPSSGKLPWNVTLTVAGVELTGASLVRIDANNSNPVAAWQGMGYPTALSAAQLAILMDASALQYQPLCTEKADIRGSGATTPTPKDSLAGAPTPNCAEDNSSFWLVLPPQAVAVVALRLE